MILNQEGSKETAPSQDGHSGPELRPCGRRYALRDGDPAVERGCCVNCKAPRVFFGPKAAQPHSGIPSPGVVFSQKNKNTRRQVLQNKGHNR
jgi:hypothetical protein